MGGGAEMTLDEAQEQSLIPAAFAAAENAYAPYSDYPVGAALLFVVQPMVTRFVLPRFGGSATVWSTVLNASPIRLGCPGSPPQSVPPTC